MVAQTRLSVPLHEHCLSRYFVGKGTSTCIVAYCQKASKPSIEKFIKCSIVVFGLCSEITDRTFLITVFICVTEAAITMRINNLENLYFLCDLSLEAISFLFLNGRHLHT